MIFGFIGLGQMGAPMAQNLSRVNRVLAFNRSPCSTSLKETKNLELVSNITELTICDCIFLCLPSKDAVETVLFGDNGLAKNLKSDTIIVDTSTVEFNATINIAKRLGQMNIHFLDAPVSGMKQRAQDGTLTMMIGGKASIAKRLNPTLETMASHILYMSNTGCGQLTKLINQLLFDINMAALAEILPVASKLGLPPELITKVVNSGTGRSYASEFFLPNILEGIFDQGYSMQNAYKDLISGAELGVRECTPMPVLAAATTTFQNALREGLGDMDKGAMILVFERLLDTKFRSATYKDK
ncbi:NAD(P)-dependent oxidoreductase [Vibrio sp. Vb339]|uniref:NAD(P)-dependent oxidoreductase n=1 Tax=Vibrio sp. Vb339 TaxID=1192013 RepID=UPI0015530481|nr:NAD(P)-dependent oxidoreductase [Vibrio sp. Vb339]